MKLIDEIEITLKGDTDYLKIYINVFENSLSAKWLNALNYLLDNQYHLEKNYCWLGWVEHQRTVQFICDQINHSIGVINQSNLDYYIDCEPYSVHNVITPDLDINHIRTNQLHKWFEELQGWSGGISNYYQTANKETKWHIRQLNLLCHELETLILSLRKVVQAPEWRRPSQLMCWLNAPRFELSNEDFELFGIDTLNRKLGGVYVGVNKAVGKHHWEVFNDEGRDSRVEELVTTGLRSQTQAAGDFDIEWARDPGAYYWQQQKLKEFRQWLESNGFDPDDKTLTIGHPCVGQVDLKRSFRTEHYGEIWSQLAQHLDVYKIKTSFTEATYNYHWSDPDYAQQQMELLR
jgi:hypothetical protein